MTATPRRTRWHHAATIALLVAWGPLFRALLDKGWMQLGGLTLVGQWAQLQGLAELVSAPAMAGIGVGLTVLTAQRDRSQHLPLLYGAAGVCGLMTAPLMLSVWLWPSEIGSWLQLDASLHHWLGWVATSGWLGMVWGLLSSLGLGQHAQGRVLVLSVATGLPTLIALLLTMVVDAHPADALGTVILTGVVVGSAGALGGLIHGLLWWRRTTRAWQQLRAVLRPVLRYTPAGIAVGLLTPLSVLAIRSSLAQHMDWEAAGTATALWRASDWVLSGAVGVLYYHHLPQLSRHVTEGNLASQLPRVLRQILWPGALALVLLWWMQGWLLPLLYDTRMQVSPLASAAFWAGDFMRVVSAVFLFALYALHASKAIAWGEWLSQPLLAGLLMLGAAQSLLWTGLAHWATYVVYAAFNACVVIGLLKHQLPK